MKSKTEKIDLIVTGFNAFGGKDFNPTESIVESLPDEISIENGNEIALSRLVLPTCCTSSWDLLQNLLDKRRKDRKTVLIMLGYAENARCVALERVALNLRDYRLPDNEGHIHTASPIVEGQANALFNDLDLDTISKKLNFAGHLTEVSNHAGTFVCNEVYFKSLLYKQENDHLKEAVFVHVPDLIPDNGKSKSVYTLDSMRELISGLIQELISKKTAKRT